MNLNGVAEYHMDTQSSSLFAHQPEAEDEKINVTVRGSLHDLLKRQQCFKAKLYDACSKIEGLRIINHFEQNVKQQLNSVLSIKQKQQQDTNEQLTDNSDIEYDNDDDDDDDEEIENDNDNIDYNLNESLQKRQLINDLLLHQQQQMLLKRNIVLPPQLRSYSIYIAQKSQQLHHHHHHQHNRVQIDKASKTSQWYWSMSKVALKSEHDRVRLKMANLARMSKDCKNLLRRINRSAKKQVTVAAAQRRETLSVDADSVVDTEDEAYDEDESTMVSRRCMPVRKTVTFKRSFIKFNLLKPYVNLIKFLLSDSVVATHVCTCKAHETCILCYLNKNQFEESLNRYKFASNDVLKQVFLDHSYTRFYKPVSFIDQSNDQNNNIDLNSSTSSTLSAIVAVTTHNNNNTNGNNYLKAHHLSQTPPPTPKSPSTSSVSSANADLDHMMVDIVLTETNKHNLNHNHYFINNKTVNIANTMMINNDILLDAGSELDPNDVHKLPNIYEELRYLSQNDENLLNGICESKFSINLLRKQKLKRKWYEYCNSSSHDLISCLTSKINTQEKKRKLQEQSLVKQYRQQQQTQTQKEIKSRRKRLSTSICSTHSLNASDSKSFFIHNENRFDIDNIVIPQEMLINSSETKIEIPPHKEIPIPSWRVLDDEYCPPTGAGDSAAEIEDLSDKCFTNRHEVHELLERYHSVYKKLERKKAKSSRGDKELTSAKLEDLCLNEFKLLVNKLENEHKLKNLHQSSNS